MPAQPTPIGLLYDDQGNLVSNRLTVAEAEAQATAFADTNPGWGWIVVPATLYKSVPDPEETP